MFPFLHGILHADGVGPVDNFDSYKKTVLIESPPMFTMGSVVVGLDIYISTMNFTTGNFLYKSSDNGLSWALLKTIYANSSSRSHPSCVSDGSDTVWVSVNHSGNTGVYIKRYTISTDTLGSEISVATGLTGALDSSLLHISGTGDTAVLLCFARVIAGANFELRCYRSTDGGATWALYSTPHTEATAGINSLEDLDAIIAGNGNVLFAWEREVTEKGAASCRQRISTDNGLTWGSQTTIIDNATYDDEGGTYVLDSAGDIGTANDLFYVYGSNKNGGTSYDQNQLFRLRSSDNGATWGNEILVLESYGTVEPGAIIDSNGQMFLVGTKHYDAAGNGAVMQLVGVPAVEPGDFNLSDGGWTQDGGLAYVVGGVVGKTAVRVDSEPRTNTRGFLANALPSTGDYSFTVDALSADNQVDIRLCFGYQDVNNHYMVEIIGTAPTIINEIKVFKRVSGTYTQLNAVSFTPSKNTWYTVRVVWSGTSIKTYIDDVLKNDFIDATFLAGAIALAAGNTVDRYSIYFTDLSVASL